MDKRLLSVLLIVFIDLLGFGVIIPIFALLFFGDISILPAGTNHFMRGIIFGLLIAVFPIAQFFGSPLIGAYSDRVGRKKAMILSLAGTACGYLLMALGIYLKNIPLIFLGRAVAGFAGGNIAVAMSAIADMSDAKTKAGNFALIGMSFGLGFIMGPFIGGKLSDPSLVSWFDFSTPFFFAALLSALNTALVFLIFRETLVQKVYSKLSLTTGIRNLALALKMKNLRTIFLVIFLIGFGFTFMTTFFQVFLVEKFSFNQSQIGDMFAFMGLCVALSQGLIARRISQKFSPEKVLKWSVLFLSLSVPLLIIPDNPFFIYLILPLIAAFNGLTFPNSTAIVSGLAGKESQGEILGINQSIQSVAMALPPLVAGFMVAIDIRLPMIASGAFIFIAWLVFVLFFGKAKEKEFHEV